MGGAAHQRPRWDLDSRCDPSVPEFGHGASNRCVTPSRPSSLYTGLGRIFPNSSTPLTAHYTEIGKVFETIERKREMKIVTLIARILLGLISVVFGLNGFLNFLSMGPMPTGLAGQFIGALFLSHYYWVVAILQIAGGLLLLANRFVPLALVLLGPVIVNIICYHVFLNHSGAGLAAVVTVLWLAVFYCKRQYFSGIFVQRA
jgi:putative oxidoreductase